jgi:hypothetical protein
MPRNLNEIVRSLIRLLFKKRQIYRRYGGQFCIYRKEFLFVYIKLEEHLKNVKTCRVPFLNPDLSSFGEFLKIILVTQSL